MDKADLKIKILAAADGAAKRTWVIGAEDRRLIAAGRKMIAERDDVLSILLEFVNNQPFAQEDQVMSKASATDKASAVQAMQQAGVSEADLTELENTYGLNWTDLWQALVQYGPAAAIAVTTLIKAVIDAFTNPNPMPVFSAAVPSGHPDHKELCKKVLDAAICTACCAARHYAVCCSEPTA